MLIRLYKKKRILFHPKLLAKMVFADPELTYDLPAAVTAATGMDALTHNMEAFLAKGYHPMCDGIALEGVRLIANALEKAVKNNTKNSRSDMMMGSLMGAVAFQKGLGVVHSMAHPLSSLLDMHHGLANAICTISHKGVPTVANMHVHKGFFKCFSHKKERNLNKKVCSQLSKFGCSLATVLLLV